MTDRSTPAPRAGIRERRDSPWLASATPASDSANPARTLDRELLIDGALPAEVAPATLLAAFMDWWMHLCMSPAKQLQITREAAQAGVKSLAAAWGQQVIEPLPQDKRFSEDDWQHAPYRWLAQAFLLQQQWWHVATPGVPGVSRHHEDMVTFAARQWLDMVAPSNFVSLNPMVLKRTAEAGGMNLLTGALQTLEDLRREALDLPPVGADAFAPGTGVALTPGRVVLRNRLMELIQYAPSRSTVHAEPVLLVPAWIMKYYVLDLSPHNSLVKHLVDHGFTVFAISWKNPGADDRDVGMDDYATLGPMAALDAIGRIVPGTQVHAAGYCLGGTLLAAVAAALGRRGPHRLKSVTLLAAQTDFTEPGELGLFIDESQVEFLERLMWRRGYLDKHQMKGAFQLLRSNDLIWSYRLRSQLLGERPPINDLMAWNADGTRLPCRMHMEYLQGMFLDNALARGQWTVDGVAVNLADIRVPIFNVATVQDHVAPWRSVFKLQALTDAEQTFVLTAGGHNTGIVNPPSRDTRSSYRLQTRRHADPLLTPDEWLTAHEPVRGSWWAAWTAWLAERSSRRKTPPPMGAARKGLPPLDAAPGQYVHQR
jgi:polyhydroxyalkanoate synthase